MTDEYERATISVTEVDKSDEGYKHFKDSSGKSWNASTKFDDLDIDLIVAGARLDLVYKTSDPKAGQKYGAKWLKRLQPATKDNTWPDKEPYNPKGSSGAHKSEDGLRRSAEEVRRTECWMPAAIIGAQRGYENNPEYQQLVDFIEQDVMAHGKINTPEQAKAAAVAAFGDDVQSEPTDDIPF